MIKPKDSYEVVGFIKKNAEIQNVSHKKIAKSAGITEASMSRYMNENRVMPFDVMVKCLENLGYEIMISMKNEAVEIPTPKTDEVIDLIDGGKKSERDVVFRDGILTIISKSCSAVDEIILNAEFDKPLSLADIRNKYPEVETVMFETALDGQVYEYGNHGAGWEKVGKLTGYA